MLKENKKSLDKRMYHFVRALYFCRFNSACTFIIVTLFATAQNEYISIRQSRRTRRSHRCYS